MRPRPKFKRGDRVRSPYSETVLTVRRARWESYRRPGVGRVKGWYYDMIIEDSGLYGEWEFGLVRADD